MLWKNWKSQAKSVISSLRGCMSGAVTVESVSWWWYGCWEVMTCRRGWREGGVSSYTPAVPRRLEDGRRFCTISAMGQQWEVTHTHLQQLLTQHNLDGQLQCICPTTLDVSHSTRPTSAAACQGRSCRDWQLAGVCLAGLCARGHQHARHRSCQGGELWQPHCHLYLSPPGGNTKSQRRSENWLEKRHLCFWVYVSVPSVTTAVSKHQ